MLLLNSGDWPSYTDCNLMALTLQGFDPSIDFAFWKSLTMPDIYILRFSQVGEAVVGRLWQETAE